VHVTLKLARGLPSLRHQALAALVFSVLRKAKVRLGTRVVQFSVQSNHLHLIVETAGRAALSRSMQGIGVRLARGLNDRLRRRGAVFGDRYHARALRTPREVRHALVYVLQNHKHHAVGAGRASQFDALSTAAYFDGFTPMVARWPPVPRDEVPVARATTWLLRVGWRRLGLIRPEEAPAS
jgi:REP element-mobilizing transposase RayT